MCECECECECVSECEWSGYASGRRRGGAVHL